MHKLQRQAESHSDIIQLSRASRRKSFNNPFNCARYTSNANKRLALTPKRISRRFIITSSQSAITLFFFLVIIRRGTVWNRASKIAGHGGTLASWLPSSHLSRRPLAGFQLEATVFPRLGSKPHARVHPRSLAENIITLSVSKIPSPGNGHQIDPSWRADLFVWRLFSDDALFIAHMPVLNRSFSPFPPCSSSLGFGFLAGLDCRHIFGFFLIRNVSFDLA